MLINFLFFYNYQNIWKFLFFSLKKKEGETLPQNKKIENPLDFLKAQYYIPFNVAIQLNDLHHIVNQNSDLAMKTPISCFEINLA